MVQPSRSQAAQYIYLAQLEAQKGTCTCKGCQLLRKCNDAMVAEALNPAPPAAGAPETVTLPDAGDLPVEGPGPGGG